MKMNRLFSQLELHFKTKRPVLLKGPAGVGKTAAVKAFAEAKGVTIYEYRAAYCEPGDLKGLCNPENGVMKFLRPEDFPREDDENCILFFDEINRASQSVMNCIMQATDGSGRIATHRLPKGCLVVAAINPDNSNYTVNAMDDALRSRFNQIEIEYDSKVLIDYAKRTEWHPRVISFLQTDKGIFNNTADSDGNHNIPTPRTLHYLSDMEKAGLLEDKDLHRETAQGLLGPVVGLEYHAFATGEQPVTLAELFSGDGIKRVKAQSKAEAMRPDLLGVTSGAVIEFLKEKGAGKVQAKDFAVVVEYLATIPADLAVGTLKQLCTAMPEYTDKFQAETALMSRLGERLKDGAA
jgi:hypothetical protein